MRSNRNDCALASSASPRESANDECRWQSTKPGVATEWRPSITSRPAKRLASSADLSIATILPLSTAMAASRTMRRCASIVISQSISAMTRSTDCTLRSDTQLRAPLSSPRTRGVIFQSRRLWVPAYAGTTIAQWADHPEWLLILPHIGQVVGDLELDEYVLVGRVLAQHGAVADTLGYEQHVAGVHDLDAHLGFPLQRALDAEDDLVGVDIAMPETHVVLAALGDVHLHAVGSVEPQRRAVRLVEIGGRERLGKDIDHAEDVGVLQHPRIDHRRLVVREHDVLPGDRHELAIDLLGRRVRLALRLVHGSLLMTPCCGGSRLRAPRKRCRHSRYSGRDGR